ncbi:hypothetical protein GWK08_09600 [Leptobacterium flavescens]|uniref:HIG1 domain-containing protein n=1 Tax=Leptobacterium flavescens TaxID=472055 RepID=A0A6P0UM94_9FLAO|nr:hypothetical protein [Leptobacterium flavescens]NER13692.1 hypothetical protein [Leptobacterium flavescens]
MYFLIPAILIIVSNLFGYFMYKSFRYAGHYNDLYQSTQDPNHEKEANSWLVKGLKHLGIAMLAIVLAILTF